MTHLIYYNEEVYLTKWFEMENNYAEGMLVVDLINWKYTTDGKEWKEVEFDHL